MKDKTILTAESVTAGHPDKLCDTIADTVLDCCLEHDPNARVACEVLATAGKFVVAGEISALTIPDISSIVRDTVRRAGYNCRDFDRGGSHPPPKPGHCRRCRRQRPSRCRRSGHHVRLRLQ